MARLNILTSSEDKLKAAGIFTSQVQKQRQDAEKTRATLVTRNILESRNSPTEINKTSQSKLAGIIEENRARGGSDVDFVRKLDEDTARRARASGGTIKSARPFSGSSKFEIVGGKAVPIGATGANISVSTPSFKPAPSTISGESPADTKARERALQIFNQQTGKTLQIAQSIQADRARLLAQGLTQAEANKLSTDPRVAGFSRAEQQAFNSTIQAQDIKERSASILNAEAKNEALSGRVPIVTAENAFKRVQISLDDQGNDISPKKTKLQTENALAAGAKLSDLIFEVRNKQGKIINVYQPNNADNIASTLFSGASIQGGEFQSQVAVNPDGTVNIFEISQRINPKLREISQGGSVLTLGLKTPGFVRTTDEQQSILGSSFIPPKERTEINRLTGLDVFISNIPHQIIQNADGSFSILTGAEDAEAFRSKDIGAIVDYLLRNNYISLNLDAINPENIGQTTEFFRRNQSYGSLYLLLQELLRITTNVKIAGQQIRERLVANRQLKIQQGQKRKRNPITDILDSIISYVRS